MKWKWFLEAAIIFILCQVRAAAFMRDDQNTEHDEDSHSVEQTTSGEDKRTAPQTGCSWNVKTSLPENQPLYLKDIRRVRMARDEISRMDYEYDEVATQEPHTTAVMHGLLDFYLPEPSGLVSIPRGTLVTFACPAGHLLDSNVAFIILECVQGYMYKIPGGSRQYNFRNIQCSTLPKSEVVPSPTADICRTIGQSQLSHHHVGFNLLINNNREFISLYDFCFENSTNDVIYSHFKLTKSVQGRQPFDRNFNFKKGRYDFYPNNVNLDYLYSQSSQNETFTRLLGSKELAEDVIVPDSPFYLVKGHLAAKAYFPYGSQQAATYWYMNAVPQFNSANNYNWKVLEDQIRRFVGRSNTVYEMFVGSSGILTHADVNNNFSPLTIYLNLQDIQPQRVRVPMLLWTVLYDPVSPDNSVAFLVLNTGDQPVLDNPMAGVCTEVCSSLPWLQWPDRTFYPSGYGTCCRLDERLFASVPEIPAHRLVPSRRSA